MPVISTHTFYNEAIEAQSSKTKTERLLELKNHENETIRRLANENIDKRKEQEQAENKPFKRFLLVILIIIISLFLFTNFNKTKAQSSNAPVFVPNGIDTDNSALIKCVIKPFCKFTNVISTSSAPAPDLQLRTNPTSVWTLSAWNNAIVNNIINPLKNVFGGIAGLDSFGKVATTTIPVSTSTGNIISFVNNGLYASSSAPVVGNATNTLSSNNVNNTITLSDTNGNSTSTSAQVGEVYRKSTSTISIPLAYSLTAGSFGITSRTFDIVGGINGAKNIYTQNITATQNSPVFTITGTLPANVTAGNYIEINNTAPIYKIVSITGQNVTVNKNYTATTQTFSNYEVFTGTITTGAISGITSTATYQTAMITALVNTWTALNSNYNLSFTTPTGFNTTLNGSFNATNSVPVNPLGEIYVVDVTAGLTIADANYLLYNQNQGTPSVWSPAYNVNLVAKDIINTEIENQIIAGTNVSVSKDRVSKAVTISATGGGSGSGNINGTGTAGFISVWNGTNTIGTTTLLYQNNNLINNGTTTLNGNVYINQSNFKATSSLFGNTGTTPRQLTMDSAGNIYTANFDGNNVTKITPAGVATQLGTTGVNPFGIAVDTAGNVYTANSAGGSITRITPAGVSSVFATGLYYPWGLTIDSSNNLYATSYFGNVVYKISTTGATSTLGTTGANPYNVIVDGSGNVFTTNFGSSTVTKITSAGTSTQFGTTGSLPYGLVMDLSGNIYTANDGDGTVTRITPAGVSTIFARTGGKPRGIVLDGKGKLYVTETQADLIIIVDMTTGATSTLITANASVIDPFGLVIDTNTGTLYSSNAGSANVSKITQPYYNKALTLDSNGNVILATSSQGITNMVTYNVVNGLFTSNVNGSIATTSIVAVADSLLEITDSTTTNSTRIQSKNRTNTCLGNTITPEVICANRTTDPIFYATQVSANNFARGVYNPQNGFYYMPNLTGITVNTNPKDPTTAVIVLSSQGIFGATGFTISDIQFPNNVAYGNEMFVIGYNASNIRIARLTFGAGVSPIATKVTASFTQNGVSGSQFSSLNDIAVRVNGTDTYTIGFVGNTIVPNDSFAVMGVDLNASGATITTSNQRTIFNGVPYGYTFINAIEFANDGRLVMGDNTRIISFYTGQQPVQIWRNPNLVSETNTDIYINENNSNLLFWAVSNGDVYSTTFANPTTDIVKYSADPNTTYTSVYGLGINGDNKVYQMFYGVRSFITDNYYVEFNIEDTAKINGVLDLSSTTRIINIENLIASPSKRMSVFSVIETTATSGATIFTAGTSGGSVGTIINNVNILAPLTTGQSNWIIPAGLWNIKVSANYTGTSLGAQSVLTKFGTDSSISPPSGSVSASSNNLYFSPSKSQTGNDGIGGTQEKVFNFSSPTTFYLTRFAGVGGTIGSAQISPNNDFQIMFTKLD